LENCRRALDAYRNALQIYSLEEFPRLYATVQNNLANVYLTQGQRVDKTVNGMKAILAAQKALGVFSLEDSPEDYGEAKGSLWLAYLTLADIEYRAENCALALQACEERLHSYRIWAAQSLQIASCCQDLAMTAIMLADMEISAEAKAEDCKKAVSAALEALQIYDVSSYPEESAEAQILLWAAYSALAEVQDCRENCHRAIQACQAAIRIYERTSLAEHADALKNLGYSFITLAEMEDRAENCQKAIDVYEQAMQYYTSATYPLEHADILRDLAFAYVTFSEVLDKEECSKKALKAYKKAFKIYRARSEELEREGHPGAHEMREKAEKCHRSMQSCKAIFKVGRKAGAAAPQQERPDARPDGRQGA
jgi:tetratricopeptide (TPR) repeat protein